MPVINRADSTRQSVFKNSWTATFKAFIHPRVITMLFLGFSAGIPILLIFSSLSLWLREAGVERSTVTYFSWAALAYSFKFVWAPLVDKLPLPILTRLLGRRRSWMLVSQIAVIMAILLMAQTNPADNGSLVLMALSAVLLGFSSATQDIVIDAYRIESAESELQALMSSTYIAGYRIGMLVAGAGALFLASYFGTSKETYNYHAWQMSYNVVAGIMLVGVITTLSIKEPDQYKERFEAYTGNDYLRFLLVFLMSVLAFIASYYFSSEISRSATQGLTESLGNKYLAGLLVGFLRLSAAVVNFALMALVLVKLNLVKKEMVVETYIAPVLDFFRRYGLTLAWLLLALIGLYRISDIVLGIIANVFYQDLGYSKIEIATVVKTFGLFMTILGGFLGGILTVRYGVLKILFLGALLSAATNLLFVWLSSVGHNLPLLYVVISADNLSAGLASAAFIAFLSSLTNVSFTAMQYAIFSSLMTLIPKALGGYSGTMVDELGYTNFFLLTALMGLPVLLLILLAGRYFQLEKKTA